VKKTMAKKKTAKKRAVKRKAKASAKRTVKAKPVAFYKQPVVAISNGFDRDQYCYILEPRYD